MSFGAVAFSGGGKYGRCFIHSGNVRLQGGRRGVDLTALVEVVAAAAAIVAAGGVEGVGSAGAAGVATLLFDATSTGGSVDGAKDGVRGSSAAGCSTAATDVSCRAACTASSSSCSCETCHLGDELCSNPIAINIVATAAAHTSISQCRAEAAMVNLADDGLQTNNQSKDPIWRF